MQVRAMQVQVNGDPMELPDEATVAVLIERLVLAGKRLAVEVNEDIVPRSQHTEFRLSEGDRVEVVHAIGGG
ncbi:sulfur carrier protein ThiS [Marinobacter sp. SS13-12]|uniref:sulfur carrier protein ThiS n=1 Tax=Marinobacter sp. SS13-12 TaxID=3050451 RepID=UPI0025574F3A|nr:sulfur carrier protein ThiS [Marinobacter sp. SS13-12]MDK8462904.1 sulfur carrier protein ThiS [Marinobacter sp. SS13-12]